MPPELIRRVVVAATCLVAVATAVFFVIAPGPANSATRPAATGTPLTGVLKLTPGTVSTKGGSVSVTGTYFRMITPAGPGHYFENSTSNAGKSSAAESYTLLAPGTDGGLKLGAYQKPPATAFNGPNAAADAIVKPESFVNIKFSISTAAKDAQTGAADSAPSLTLNGTKITGDLEAWTAEWNRVYFNQGSPKPGSSPYPGLTRPVTGTYNPKTRAFTITWYSQIVGGPFNDFTGYWHLQGFLTK